MTKKQEAFVHTVWTYYRAHGRHQLPWRLTTDPYHIIVSEVMLQQTQVDRVIPKYAAFLKHFPTLKKLAAAPLGEVLREWQGLGYNRRAKMLHQMAKEVAVTYHGMLPGMCTELQKLSGVGPYTAGAVAAFAANEPVVIIETNIRTVFLHHFFKDATDVPDSAISRLIATTLDRENPREWYWALMDYGAYIKKTHGNPNSRSKHHAVQSRFKGSDRQIRGAILRLLAKEKGKTRTELHSLLPAFDEVRLDAQLERLQSEGMTESVGGRYRLPR